MAYVPRHMLVTGGAGFIGANFVRHALQRWPSLRIITLDLMTYAGSPANLAGLPDAGRHLLVEGDICDASLVERLLQENAIDTVVHFAAESHVDRSIAGPAEFLRTNVVGTYTLLEACRRYWQQDTPADRQANRRFHHISTDEVYGSLGDDDPPFLESTAYAPNSPYSASKAASDHFVRAWHHTYGLPVTTSNCSNNFGPCQHAEKLIPTVIRHCLAGSPIPVYGNGRNIRDWLYVGDHCSGIAAILERGVPGETYNIGGNNELRNIDLVQAICAEMDRRRPAGSPHARLISYVTDRPGHDWRYAVGTAHIERTLGWTPQTPFTEALARTLDWYLADPSRCAA